MYYKNFINATYAPAGYLFNTSIEQMEADILTIKKYIKIDKIYLETYRGEVLVDRAKMKEIKALFIKHGFIVSGGITTTVKASLMGSMCFTNPENRKRLGEIASFTAEMFDEVILDDFYFTNCRCEECIKAKGNLDWTTFRLSLMKDISENVILKNAKAANKNVNMIIKYPNWYDSYQATGYNLEEESKLFDMIYTGTETRDPHYTHQNLPRYLSYFLPRLMENIKPGKNGGGWYDPYECSVEDYLQQAYLTMFSKCRENMLFCFPSFFDCIPYIAAVNAVYDEADDVMGQLGKPVGVACYKPYNSHGERRLYEYLGNAGIPLEPYPYYPSSESVILLTADAAWDKEIVAKIKKSLLEGKKIFITSGLYEKLAGSGIEDILPLEIGGKKAVSDVITNSFYGYGNMGHIKTSTPIMAPHISYNENDLWVLSTALTPYSGHPLLLCGAYGRGKLYILTVPDTMADIYNFPAETLTLLRKEMDLPVSLECGGLVGLFLYDNSTFIIQSFLQHPEIVRVCIKRGGASIVPLLVPIKKMFPPRKFRSTENESVFDIYLPPGRFAAFRIEG